MGKSRTSNQKGNRMNLDKNNIKNLIGYEVTSKLNYEFFIYVKPFLKEIEFEKIDKSSLSLDKKRKAKTEYLNRLKYIELILKENSNILDRVNEAESDVLIDKLIDVINDNIKVE